jgi:hypothetical protein
MMGKVGSGFVPILSENAVSELSENLFVYSRFSDTYQPHKATWRSGYATVCRTAYFPSNFSTHSYKLASNAG